MMQGMGMMQGAGFVSGENAVQAIPSEFEHWHKLSATC